LESFQKEEEEEDLRIKDNDDNNDENYPGFGFMDKIQK
jgi:hypothetical protein